MPKGRNLSWHVVPEAPSRDGCPPSFGRTDSMRRTFRSSLTPVNIVLFVCICLGISLNIQNVHAQTTTTSTTTSTTCTDCPPPTFQRLPTVTPKGTVIYGVLLMAAGIFYMLWRKRR